MPADVRGHHRVVVIGAGPGGICTAVQLQRAGIEDFVVLEAAEGVGGTWRRNRYPGLACDIPSHLYSFSFAPKADWSRPYARQPEILEYLEQVVSEHSLRPHFRFDTSVESASWDDEAHQWVLVTGGGTRLTAQFVVASPGMFGKLRYPDIEGRELFAGTSIHTGAWPPGCSTRGRAGGRHRQRRERRAARPRAGRGHDPAARLPAQRELGAPEGGRALHEGGARRLRAVPRVRRGLRAEHLERVGAEAPFSDPAQLAERERPRSTTSPS